MSLLFETVKALREARRLIKKGWSRKAYARDRWRHPVDSSSKRAVCFCATGAINRATWGKNFSITEQAETQIKNVISSNGFHNIVDWNDAMGRTKQEVVRAFTKAIQTLEAIG